MVNSSSNYVQLAALNRVLTCCQKNSPPNPCAANPLSQSSSPCAQLTSFYSQRTHNRTRRFPDNATATNTNHRCQQSLTTIVANTRCHDGSNGHHIASNHFLSP